MKESRFFAFSLPASTATPKRADSAAAARHPTMARHRSTSGGHQRAPVHFLEEVRGSALPAGAPAGSQWRAGDRQQCAASSSSETAVSEADNVRGQDATRLKPYLEHRVEA